MLGWAEPVLPWAGLSQLFPQPARSPGELLVCRKRAGRGMEGKAREQPLLTAHRRHRDLCQPQSQYQTRRQCTASFCSSVTFPILQRARGADTGPGPCPAGMLCPDTHEQVTQSCLFKLKQKDSLLSLPEKCVELPSIILWMTPENRAFK